MAERLQKILSQWGVASRRGAEALIAAGRVRVNGHLAELGQRADPACDRIEVDGQPLPQGDRPETHYLLLHKPAGVVSTCRDTHRRRTVLDLIPAAQQAGLHPVGRLDADSTGALLLTNDGELTFALTHPSHDVPKTYRVWVAGSPSRQRLAQWRQGVVLEGRMTRPAEVDVLERRGDRTELRIVLREGRNRQIRRVAEQLGHPVLALHRVAIGSIELGSLPEGELRSLVPSEVAYLKSALVVR
jgi:23S rRNA pseudouridine2605 synthase